MELIRFQRIVNGFRSFGGLLPGGWKSFLFLGVWVVVAAVGCDYEKDCDCPEESIAYSLHIEVGDDTLRFLPGDSAETAVTVYVRNQYGGIASGIRVNMSLSNAQIGFIEFLDPLLRDTTDIDGIVEMMFVSIGTSADVAITAEAGGASASAQVAVRPSAGAELFIRLTLEPDSVLTQAGVQTAINVEVWVWDFWGESVTGRTVELMAVGPIGELLLPPDLPALDDSGISRCLWEFPAREGDYCLSARLAMAERTKCVHVDIEGELEEHGLIRREKQ